MTLDPVLVHQKIGALALGNAIAVISTRVRAIHGYWSVHPVNDHSQSHKSGARQ